MNILIITTYFVPDSAIAAVRPYMFAKHLAEMGDCVTVLRSGEFELPPFDEYDSDFGFEVISSLGKDCDAEKFTRGEYEGFSPAPKGRFYFIPQKIKMPLKFIRDIKNVILKKPPQCFEHQLTILNSHKRTIDRLFRQGKKYEVVFSTCGSIENIFAGRYAAKMFNATWTMDFRDSMIMSTKLNPAYMWNFYAKRATVCALKEAECITAVSKDLCNELMRLHPRSDIFLLNNGYDEREHLLEVIVPQGIFSFCYAGRIYEDSKQSLSVLVKCISNLITDGRIDKERVRFYYAGSAAREFREVFEAEGMSEILTDKGYLSKTDTMKLEMESDVFTVLSWNKTDSKGILTGKFYEGIKVGKPIIAVVSGNAPNSELLYLQKKYKYGFCYEECNKKISRADLEKYIESLYNEKLNLGKITYSPSEKLKKAFSYEVLSKRLRTVLKHSILKVNRKEYMC